MKKIPLTQGKFALVDDEDFDWLNQWKWHYGGRGYAVRTVNHSEKIYMHRVLLKPSKGKETDHKNMNRLDNRKNNLRICDARQNQLNTNPNSRNTSGYRNIYWNTGARKWCIYLRINKKNKFMGYFLNKIDAVRKYNKIVKDYYGEFARLNPI